ncbi:hypothetical protein GIB67_040157 [Kingdonia uniflora]|uniref:Uncharacterized protein n=1 Tax=Kingdonia uniflora TaxID=39325 RepID=A0A7J7MUS8_9MAGN|nr:hypothetical protein GIB67_040157 [Kingdonia uniflora]
MGFPGQLVSYPLGSDTFREFRKAKGAIRGQTWNDNIIWVKGNCLQRDDEELLGLRFRSVKKREKVAKVRAVLVDDLKEVEERAKLAILQEKEDTSQMVDAIKADTYAEEEEEEAGLLGVVDGLDDVSPQTVLDNQGDDVELPEDGSEKVVKEMSLIINDLKSGLTREIKTSKALLSVQAELLVKLDASRAREDHTLMCNQEFTEQFDKMKEMNENSEDQFIKTHFRLEKLNQVVSDLSRQVEDKDFGIKKGLEDLYEATKRAENFQRQVHALAVKSKQVDMAQYCIQALERTEELYRSNLNSCRIEFERMRQKFIEKDDELRVAQEKPIGIGGCR